MNRREFLNLCGSSIMAAAAGAGCYSNNTRHACNSKSPNIIFLLTDDQRWDALGCAGNPYIQTPNLDSLAADGVRFSNSFVTTPICCTSRASFLSGQYARRHGIHGFDKDFSPQAFAKTYPAVLKDAGYKTGFIGKYGVGTHMPVSEFDVWNGIEGQPVYEHRDEDGNYKHLTSIMSEQSIDFIKNCGNDKPFCLSVSFKAPHVQDGDPRQFIYDPALKDLYKDVEIPLPQTASDEYFQSLPAFLRDDATEARKRWKLRFSTPEKHQESVKGYYRLITGVDIVVGKIRKQLQASGCADNTVIIFMGDNGFFLGEKGLAGKWYPLEESIRVPLIVYDPRLKQPMRGRVVDQMALNIDIAPTILEMANASIPKQMQGMSLVPLLEGRKTGWRNEFLVEHLFDYKPIPKSEAIRTDKWKYLRYFNEGITYEQLYDIEHDPQETHDLATDERYRDELDKMRVKCNKLIELSA